MKLKSVALLLLLTLVFAEDTKDEINDPYDPKTTKEYLADVKAWADKMNPETFRGCDIAEDLPQDTKQWQILFRTVSCKAKNAIKNYEFDGQILKGYLEGEGTLSFPATAREQKRCIKLTNSILGGTLKSPDRIKGNFNRGSLKPCTIVKLEWKDELIMSTCTKENVLHGLTLLTYPDGQWKLSKLINGQIKNSSCWMKNEKYLMQAQCNNGFKIDKTQNVTVFTNQITSIISGKFSLENSILEATDVKIAKVKMEDRKMRRFEFDEGKLKFQFDLQTEKREYLLPKNYCESLVTSEDDEQLIKNYLRKIQIFDIQNEDLDLAKENSKFLLTNVKKIQNNLYSAHFDLFQSESLKFEYFGALDSNEKFHGFAVMITQPPTNKKITEIQANFEHGILQGPLKVLNPKGTQETIMNTKNGMVHGFVITYGSIPLLTPETKGFIKNGTSLITKFDHGIQDANFAIKPLFNSRYSRQGFLYEKDGKTSYVYNDFQTALVGEFQDNLMISGQKSIITNAICQNNELILTFSQPSGPIFKYNKSTTKSFGLQPLVPDPMEASMVYVANSNVPHGGHGLFAKKDLEKDTIVSFYNGFRCETKEEMEIYGKECPERTEGTSEWDKMVKCMKYRINGFAEVLFDIPPWKDDLNLYNATLAHKVNNAFWPKKNAEFAGVEHPRFGLIPCVKTIKNVKEDEEIFLDYGYDQINAGDTQKTHQWYFDQKEQVIRENRLAKEATSDIHDENERIIEYRL